MGENWDAKSMLKAAQTIEECRTPAYYYANQWVPKRFEDPTADDYGHIMAYTPNDHVCILLIHPLEVDLVAQEIGPEFNLVEIDQAEWGP